MKKYYEIYTVQEERQVINIPIVCTLNEAEREQRRKVFQKVRTHVQEVKSLDDGYAFRFKADEDTFDELIRLIRLERRCCQFLQFSLTVEPNTGPVWLEITGQGETKNFLKSEMDLQD